VVHREDPDWVEAMRERHRASYSRRIESGREFEGAPRAARDLSPTVRGGSMPAEGTGFSQRQIEKNV
jgi:hypothetical protein